MALASILALIDPRHGEATLKAAALVGHALGAPIDAIVIKPDPRDSIPAIGEAMTGDLVEQVMAQAEKAGAERALAARTIFDAAALDDQATFLEVVGREEAVIAREGRARALTLLPCGGGGETQAIGAALFETGRPALIAPLHAVSSIGKRAVIFWKDSQEAARAIWEATPILRQADQVRIVTVGDDLAASQSLDRMAAGLARAGIPAERKLIEPGNGDDSARLIDDAAEMDADLIVMGAYSHSRLRELVFGGVTLDILDNLARPVFMAH